MTRSVKNAAGSSLRCIDDNASLAQALSSVNSDFQNIRSCSLFLTIWRKVLISITSDPCLSLLHPPDRFIHRDQLGTVTNL